MELEFDSEARAVARLDIIVENTGRVNYGQPHDFMQKKGMWEGPVYIDDILQTNWTHIPLEFKTPWVNGLNNWKPYTTPPTLTGPHAFKITFTVNVGEKADTFLDMSNWGKGVVFLNGFNLGRYWSTVGPTKTLYVPAPLLREGENTVNEVMPN